MMTLLGCSFILAVTAVAFEADGLALLLIAFIVVGTRIYGGF